MSGGEGGSGDGLSVIWGGFAREYLKKSYIFQRMSGLGSILGKVTRLSPKKGGRGGLKTYINPLVPQDRVYAKKEEHPLGKTVSWGEFTSGGGA